MIITVETFTVLLIMLEEEDILFNNKETKVKEIKDKETKDKEIKVKEIKVKEIKVKEIKDLV